MMQELREPRSSGFPVAQPRRSSTEAAAALAAVVHRVELSRDGLRLSLKLPMPALGAGRIRDVADWLAERAGFEPAITFRVDINHEPVQDAESLT